MDFTCQITVSSLDPGKVQYAVLITSPANGIQPITFVHDNYELLEASLKEAVNEFNPQKVEVIFHQNRVNSYKNKIEQHEERIKQLEDPDYVDEDDEIEMEKI